MRHLKNSKNAYQDWEPRTVRTLFDMLSLIGWYHKKRKSVSYRAWLRILNYAFVSLSLKIRVGLQLKWRPRIFPYSWLLIKPGWSYKKEQLITLCVPILIGVLHSGYVHASFERNFCSCPLKIPRATFPFRYNDCFQHTFSLG